MSKEEEIESMVQILQTHMKLCRLKYALHNQKHQMICYYDKKLNKYYLYKYHLFINNVEDIKTYDDVKNLAQDMINIRHIGGWQQKMFDNQGHKL